MTRTVILDAAQAAILERLIAAGRFASSQEAATAGLALLMEREARAGDLRAVWLEGVEAGGYRPGDEVLDELDARYTALEKPGA